MHDKYGLRHVFRCKTFAFIGDSIVRVLAQRFVRVLHRKKSWFHVDYHHHIPKGDIQVDFFWRPKVRANHQI